MRSCLRSRPLCAELCESASLPRLTGCKLDGMSHCKTSITAFHEFYQLHYLACLRLSALLCTNLSRTSKQMLVQTPSTGLQVSSSAARLDHSCHNVLVSRCMEDSSSSRGSGWWKTAERDGLTLMRDAQSTRCRLVTVR